MKFAKHVPVLALLAFSSQAISQNGPEPFDPKEACMAWCWAEFGASDCYGDYAAWEACDLDRQNKLNACETSCINSMAKLAPFKRLMDPTLKEEIQA